MGDVESRFSIPFLLYKIFRRICEIMKKGEIFEGIIENIEFPNKGIVWVKDEASEEMVRVIVKNGMPGQKVRFQINKKRKNRCEGRLLEVLQKSEKETRQPACEEFPACGGCMYQTMLYEEQLNMKEEQIKKLFDDAVERYNVGKRKDRQIANYYEKIRQGKQEKLFHEVIFQIGNREDMAVGTSEGNLAVKILDEYVKDFQKRNPTLRVFSCYLHQDEATPHLHIDFVPYVTNWKGKGMDTRVSLKQALKSLGFQGGNKHDTELNQWINHEKEVLAEIAKQHGIEWEQKGTHEEHLDVYNFKKKERKKEVQELEQEKENLTAENKGLTSQVAEARADIKLLEEEKIQFQKDKETAEKRAKKAETELKKLEDRREFLQPVMDNVSKEIKEYGMIKTFLPEATALERAVTYRDKKIKPLFIEMKNKIGAMAAQVKELTRERDSWKSKFQKKKQEHEKTKKELAEVQKDYQKLSGEKEILQGIADRYNRLLRMLGKDMVERLVQDDIRMQAELEAKKQKEQMPKKIGDRIQWARERSEEHNAQIKKNKAKYRGMEL